MAKVNEVTPQDIEADAVPRRKGVRVTYRGSRYSVQMRTRRITVRVLETSPPAPGKRVGFSELVSKVRGCLASRSAAAKCNDWVNPSWSSKDNARISGSTNGIRKQRGRRLVYGGNTGGSLYDILESCATLHGQQWNKCALEKTQMTIRDSLNE